MAGLSFVLSEKTATCYMVLALLILGIFAVRGSAPAADIEFVTQELPWAVIDRPYAPPPLDIRASGACPLRGVGYAVVGGVAPPGIQLSRLGYFTGSPLRTGVFPIGIRVSNGCSWTAKRFTLTVTGAPVITVSPTRLVFDGSGEKELHVSATWPKLPYTATASAEWVKVSPAHGFTPRETSALVEDQVVVAVDTETLKPGHYSATIAISAWQALEAPMVTVQLDVAGDGIHPTMEKPGPSGSPTSVSPP
ncbi:MAG TPA: hypothetical protein VGR73_04995 [Bryobacteraceae bacterium]|nr:hypothetical protein [Bryobacteraceae bacterium]